MLDTDPEWFKRAVFYEVLVRAFVDSNGDGIGDLAGLTTKLDYLQWLGVDCLWLPPFFPSPMGDGGYDVSDYRGVTPEVGTVHEFREFVEGAHERGMRVIIDFVMNHTSDQHPWFQESRRDPDGPYGDYYVWRDKPDAYRDARVIFVDTEPSNWSYDEVRRQWYWHRFFHHQPDLNFENPRVVEEMLSALRFWLDLGIDGFRLDAVPYLIEEDGTNCENLPGTHDILKRIRAEVDAHYPGTILLCEANQWPRDVVEYFGDDDECHMAFHFPVMPRLFMGLRKGSRECISEILADTPQIPPGAQWGTFLRNHDELTLEMVSEEDRDYMWSEYAPDPRMKCNIGIRRRLSPLMDGHLPRIHLLHGLLLALPGSPCLYYGDEIGMGDNIWLKDRDGVRTPMQWNDSPGAGFSTADEEAFFQPLITDPDYCPEVINVEQQLADPGSLLQWLRALLAIRRNHPVFGLGDFRDLGGDNMAVFSFARTSDEQTVVCVANLTDSTQTARLDLSEWVDHEVTNLLRDLNHEPIGPDAYELSVAPYGFYWLELSAPENQPVAETTTEPEHTPVREVLVWEPVVRGGTNV